VGYEESVLLPFLYGSIFIFDLIYFVMVLYAGHRGAITEVRHNPDTPRSAF
jgi:hypothetical protein